MRFPGIVLGYHGCDRKVAESILAGKSEVRSSTNDYDWLGTGAYFWENNPARALSWAELLASSTRSSPKKVTKPAVIGAIIDPGNCLDLAEESSLELVTAAFRGYERLSSIADLPLPRNIPAFDGDVLRGLLRGQSLKTNRRASVESASVLDRRRRGGSIWL